MIAVRITLASLLAVAACGGSQDAPTPAPAPAQPATAAEPQPPPDLPITMDAARQTALARVPGEVTEEELEQENRRWVYEFDIKPAQASGAPAAAPGTVQEVTVDAQTGEVVTVEEELDLPGEANEDDGEGDSD